MDVLGSLGLPAASSSEASVDRTGSVGLADPSASSSDTFAPLHLLWADPWALDYIELRFSGRMSADGVLRAVSSYSIAPLSTAAPVTIFGVDVGTEATTDRVFLWCSSLTEGVLYALSVTGAVRDAAGGAVVSSWAQFYGRRTKIDSMLAALPPVYEKSPSPAPDQGVHRKMVNMVGRAFDLAFGSRRDQLP